MQPPSEIHISFRVELAPAVAAYYFPWIVLLLSGCMFVRAMAKRSIDAVLMGVSSLAITVVLAISPREHETTTRDSIYRGSVLARDT